MDEIIIKAYESIDRHLSDEFSLDELARYVGYSSYHFARRFKELTGKTVMECVREKRIMAAAEEIKAGANICNTAMKYGFDTHAGFTKAFLTVYGCTPIQCAQHALKKNEKGMVSVEKPFWIPFGVLFDNNYVQTNGIEDELMKKLLEEMKRQCRMMNISTLISPQFEGSDNAKAFIKLGFTEAWKADGWVYLAIAV